MNKTVKALGLVFGDIGTSPIYTLTVVFLIIEPTQNNVLGVLSIVFWTLIILTTIQYSILAMSLSIRGEGGTSVLAEIFKSLCKSSKSKIIVTFLSFIGISFLIGDSVITPSISILSAVEGIVFIPGLPSISQETIVVISLIIAMLLFMIQKKGTEKIASAFGPIMLVWFSCLFLFGLVFISSNPSVLKAINPYYAIEFILHNGWKGYLALGEIILCATGSEAMYADMGHLGAKPIKVAWGWVFTSLFFNYFGQGAFLLNNLQYKNLLFEMVLNVSSLIYIPFLILSIVATIIASQAMISGIFSIVYQAIMTRIMPILKISYTSEELRSQIYIGTANWFLFIAVVFIMIEFGSSTRLASAYGLAVTAVMCITGILIMGIFYLKKKYVFLALSVLPTILAFIYFFATLHKIPHGGYWSIVIAAIPFIIIYIFTEGQKRLYRFMNFMSKEEFILKFSRVYATNPKISGSAIFFIKDTNNISPYIIEAMFYNGIIYNDNIFMSLVVRTDPYGIIGLFKENLCEGIRVFEIQFGYLEVVNVEEILRENNIEERAIFYGVEDISAKGIIWKMFAFIKRITPSFVRFYQLPSRKLHGVLTRVEM